jgi:preprotein translocase subunit SecA
MEAVQRVVEGQHFQMRQVLWKYQGVLESHRREVHARRRELLEEAAEPALLLALDELWADYLAGIQELRDGIHWRSWGGRNPFHEYIRDISAAFDELRDRMDRLQSGEEDLPEHSRGATWTYLVTDNPWGDLGERMAAAARRQLHDLGLLRAAGR